MVAPPRAVGQPVAVRRAVPGSLPQSLAEAELKFCPGQKLFLTRPGGHGDLRFEILNLNLRKEWGRR